MSQHSYFAPACTLLDVLQPVSLEEAQNAAQEAPTRSRRVDPAALRSLEAAAQTSFSLTLSSFLQYHKEAAAQVLAYNRVHPRSRSWAAGKHLELLPPSARAPYTRLAAAAKLLARIRGHRTVQNTRAEADAIFRAAV